LSQRPEDGDALYDDVALKALLEEVAAPHKGFDLEFEISVRVADGSAAPRIRRMPEVIHGLSTLVENAADFASRQVRLVASVDAGWIEIEIADDVVGRTGGRIAGEVFPVLGDPQAVGVSRRDPGAAGDVAEEGGVGVGERAAFPHHRVDVVQQVGLARIVEVLVPQIPVLRVVLS
ncbi:hypothetical protein, partial [Mycolicibacterium poriferae]|uniref:hypothetical protein n=1 Tax=Mycolicibacterium poriferae TaxID=39694 RepID=UPI003D2F5E4D